MADQVEHMPAGFEWKEPPLGTHRGLPHRPYFEMLMTRPGAWARVISDRASGSAAGNFRRGALRTFGGKWETVSRKKDNGRYDIYARYLGGAER